MFNVPGSKFKVLAELDTFARGISDFEP